MPQINIRISNHSNSKYIIFEHLKSMSFPLDGYMENKLRESTISEIMINQEVQGYIATLDEIIWFFYLMPEYYHLGAEVLAQFIRETGIKKTTVLTCDIAYNGILSDFQLTLLSKEGRFFIDGGHNDMPNTSVQDASFRLATVDDIPTLSTTVKGYYPDFKQSILANQVYLLEKEGTILGCGTLNPSGLFENWYSLGVTVLKEHRRKGVGTTLLWHLKQVAYKQGASVMAGCWYENTIIGKCLIKVNMLPIAKEQCYEIGNRDVLPAKSGTLVVKEVD